MLGSAFKTFVMFAGEYDFGEMRFSSSPKMTKDGSWDRPISDVETLNDKANEVDPPKLTYNHKDYRIPQGPKA